MDLDELNILGNEISTIADALSTAAAVLSAENVENPPIEPIVLELIANEIMLLGDLILAVIAETQAANNTTISRADELNIYSNWIYVLGDILAIESSGLEYKESLQ